MLKTENLKATSENKTITDEKISHAMICRTYSGGMDLYHGVPDLEGATVITVNQDPSEDDYVSDIVLRTKNNSKVLIQIRQNKC